MTSNTFEETPLPARGGAQGAATSFAHAENETTYPAIQAVAAENARMVKVQGKAASGKTQALVKRCAYLVKGGVDARDIVVSTSNSFAAADFRKRLEKEFARNELAGARNIHVSCALDLCAEVLADPEATQATERQAHLLNTAEYKFFLEDMRTLGQPARRLRGMLSFFYRQWANLAARDEWIVGGEENELYTHMVKVLSAQNAMLAQEAPYLCAQFLKSDAGAAFRKKFRYMLADDFQDLSRAEQTCLCLLAGTQIVVSGNAGETIERKGTYPYPEGFSRFETTRKNVRAFTLADSFCEASIASFTQAIGLNDENYRACAQAGQTDVASVNETSSEHPDAENPGSNAFANGCAVIKWALPEDEINGMTKYIRALADKAPEESICVVVANRQWARSVEGVLAKRGFSICGAESAGEIAGDPRTTERAQTLMSYTLLKLIAQPENMTAWRSWCGFGNYLTNSDAWSGLIEYAQKRNVSLYDALGALADMQRAGDKAPFLRAYALAERYSAGLELIEKHKGRKGFALLQAIGAEKLHEFKGVSHKIAGDEHADELFAIVDENIFRPEFENAAKSNVIHVATYQTVAGLSYDNVFIVGCIDGFAPKREAFEVVSTEENREHILSAERRAFLRSVSAARKRLVLSYFSKAPLDLAERTKMQVMRVRSENDERLALVRPSSFFAEAGSSLPSTIGGQAFLSQAGF